MDIEPKRDRMGWAGSICDGVAARYEHPLRNAPHEPELGAAVSGPAETWIAKLPEGIPRIEERLSFLDAPINTLRTFLAAANNFGAQGRSKARPAKALATLILASLAPLASFD
jgi:hypothetical protein